MTGKNSYKILVVSDSHGNAGCVRKCVMMEEPFDLLIHCGDVEDDIERILGDHEYGVYAVRGNCDFLPLPPLVEIKAGYYRIVAVHGHEQRAGYTNATLLRLARERRADVVLFGHTHVPEVQFVREEGVLLVNPGSCARPRQESRRRTYAVLTITEDALPSAEIRELPE